MSAPSLDRVVDALERCGCMPGWANGRDRFNAHCPAHDDRDPSLSVKYDGARVLLHCFAGCESEDVLDALSLSWPDLWDVDARPPNGNHGEPPRRLDRANTQRATQDAAAGIEFIPSDQLLQGDPEEYDWQWEGGIVTGCSTLFGGKPKAGKSELLYALAEATATRQPTFLGRALKSGRVVYAAEEAKATLKARFPRHPDIYLLPRDKVWPKPSWTQVVHAARDKALEVGAVLVIFDTFSFWGNLPPEAEKDAGRVQPLIDELVVITAANIPTVVAHHHRKGGGEEGEGFRGTNAIVGAVDGLVEVERIEDAPANHRRVVVTARWAEPPVLVVSWNAGSGYAILGEAADRRGTRNVGWRERLLKALPQDGEGATYQDLEQLLDTQKNKWLPALDELREDDLVARTGEGKKGDPYRFTRAPQDSIPHSIPTAGMERTENVQGPIPDSVIPLDRTESGMETQQGCYSVPRAGNGNGNSEDEIAARLIDEFDAEDITDHDQGAN